ncbi:hypothetical protein [Tenacibaculum holothuriorum]|uniref:hypothetical protein n=1 Tax=Tenacibaculum holothuriorum TaxID=1635173 RepID=UPI000A32074F|nr:hypothetical protein [Tenacibaculum holothuriorum]
MKSNFKLSIIITLAGLLLQCKQFPSKDKVTITTKVPEKFNIYQPSEMSMLMREMLKSNQELREKIIADKEDIGDFNEAFLKIHTAKLTSSDKYDDTYPTYAKHFEQMQKAVFTVAKEKRKEQFNNVVNACVACHTNRCSGPIPRIQKLAIQ